MTNIEKFNETVAILVKAYLNDTLIQGHPCGCGCGNIIAAHNDIRVKRDFSYHDDEELAWWDNDKIGSGFDWFKFLYPKGISSGNALNGLTQIESTGYTPGEFMSIEQAFEDVLKRQDGSYSKSTPESVFAGLMEVVDALAEIHSIDLAVKENAKLMFVK